MRKIKSLSLQYYIFLGIIWTVLAIILDYLLIVKAFRPEDGYYKLDVYIYYVLTFAIPVIVGWYKQQKNYAEDISYQPKKNSPAKCIFGKLLI